MAGLEVVIEYTLAFVGLVLAPIGIVVLVIAAFRRHRQGLIAGSVCLLLSAVLLLRLGYAEFWQIDACLDQGGAWNDETETCAR